MSAHCYQCEAKISLWTDVTYNTDDRTFCSLRCVYRYRGKKKIV